MIYLYLYILFFTFCFIFQGYVIVKDFFTREELDPCRQACDDLVEDLAQKLYKAGKIKNLYKDHGFKDRLILLDEEWPGAVILLLKLGKLPQRLLNAVEQIVGPEISANPVWNIRPKAPGHEQTIVPWHQDSSYFDNTSYKTMVATAWVPFVDSTRDNGCLEMVAGGHRKGLIAEHKCCDNFYVMLDDETMEAQLDVDITKDVETAEVPYGGVLLFNNCIPHRSIPMKERMIRWSVDLRFQSSDRPDGFFGLKQLYPMRSKKDPNLRIDWEAFDRGDRYEIMKKFELEKEGLVSFYRPFVVYSNSFQAYYFVLSKIPRKVFLWVQIALKDSLVIH
ncbi:hypothetical protein FSP39_016495 [Pinctada imbricata]|uniref:Uncharacterized protein n=1 Tax=Pinctada imbricata TaxID=66713 RepID=A0AA88XMP2_PINIB|nr:hypothetical protein FSP39_016495 [Pinctada imbricata]